VRPEFFTFLKEVTTDVAKLQGEGRMLAGPVWYQWDNARIHSYKKKADDEAARAAAGISSDHVLEHPPYSCDFNRVVENAHSMIMNAFRDVLATHPHVDDAEGYIKLFKQVVMGEVLRPGGKLAIPPESCERNFKKLPQLWSAVIEAKGDYPHKRYMQ